MTDCIVCCEPITLFGIGECGHKSTCARCLYKMRAKQQNLHCTLCKELCQTLLITDDPKEKLPKDVTTLIEYKDGLVFFSSARVKELFEKNIACKCMDCGQMFIEASEYKTHLETQHFKYLCSVCLVHRPILLSEQKTFYLDGLHRHMNEGDTDENENLILFHPYCEVRISNPSSADSISTR